MDTSPKIYDIQLVINNIEVGGATAKVLSIECSGSRMFLGTAEGYLLEYFITDEKSKTFFSRVRQANLNKGQPIIQIRSASAFDSLIILSGTTLSLFDSQTLEVKGSNSISGVTYFAVDENPVSDDPFSVSICFSKKKSVVTAQVSEKGFTFSKEISLDAMTVCLAMESGLVCAALSTGRYVFVDSTATKKSVLDLCEFDPKEVLPKVVHVGKEEFLVIGPGGLGVFTTSRGTSERPPMVWSDKVNQLTVDGLNVVAVGSDAIFVSSLSDPGTSNAISFPGAKSIALSEGKLYIGTARSLYRFKPISIEEQVDALLNSDKIDQALSLLEMSQLKGDKKDFVFRKIHRRAVFTRMEELKLPLCSESINYSFIDLREILSLFPKILPTSTTFTRVLPPLHDFIDINQMTKGDSDKICTIACFVLDHLTSYDAAKNSKEVSTSLVKMAAKYDRTKFDSLLDQVQQLGVDYEDCFEWMEEQKMFNSKAVLYLAKGEIKKALEIWLELLCDKIQSTDVFDGIDIVIETLLSCNNDQIVWEYYEKLAQIDSSRSLEVFTKRKPSPVFQPLEIAEKLSSNPKACREYLNHCVDVMKLEDEDLHTFLATLYIDSILGHNSATDADVNDLRGQFRTFLISSKCLKVQFLIGKISNTKLRLELAILHGKAGDHAPALKILVEDLEDHAFAREYCKNIHDPSQRKSAFVDLFKTYMQKSDKTEEITTHGISVLQDFVEEFDLCSVLPLLPDDCSIAQFSQVFRRAVRVKLHKYRRTAIVNGLSKRLNTLYHLEIDSTNQGYQIDEDSVCGICWRKFDGLEPVQHYKGNVVHSKCV